MLVQHAQSALHVEQQQRALLEQQMCTLHREEQQQRVTLERQVHLLQGQLAKAQAELEAEQVKHSTTTKERDDAQGDADHWEFRANEAEAELNGDSNLERILRQEAEDEMMSRVADLVEENVALRAVIQNQADNTEKLLATIVDQDEQLEVLCQVVGNERMFAEQAAEQEQAEHEATKSALQRRIYLPPVEEW